MHRLLVFLGLLVGLASPLAAGAAAGGYANGTTVEYRRDPVSQELQWRWGAWAEVDGDLLWVWTVWGSTKEDPKEPDTASAGQPLEHPALQLPGGKAKAKQRLRQGDLEQAEFRGRSTVWVKVPPAKEGSRPGGGTTLGLGIDEDGGTAPRERPWI